MKTFVFACALWGVALLPQGGCQSVQTRQKFECNQSSQNETYFDQCLDACDRVRGNKYTKDGILRCDGELSPGTILPYTLEFIENESGTQSGDSASPTDSQPDNEITNDSALLESPMNGSPNRSEDAKEKKKELPVGAIAGGVVGGVIFLAIAGFLIFFFLRRKRNGKVHHEAVAVEKSRASSPASPIYGGGAPSSAAPTRQTTYEDSLSTQPQQQQQQPLQFTSSPVPAPPPPPPVIPPAELHSREVDEDGVSVSSFDMQRSEERSVPRLPVYHRDTPPGGSSAAL